MLNVEWFEFAVSIMENRQNRGLHSAIIPAKDGVCMLGRFFPCLFMTTSAKLLKRDLTKLGCKVKYIVVDNCYCLEVFW